MWWFFAAWFGVSGWASAAENPSDAAGQKTQGEEFSKPPVEHWRVRLPGGRVNSASHTERATPVIVGDEIYVGTAAGQGIYRLARSDGGLKGHFDAEASVQASPLVLEDGVIFSDIGGDTYAYDLEGTLRWKHDGRAPILASPVHHEGRVYLTDVEDRVVALEASDGALLWQYQQRKDPTRRSGLSLYAAPRAVPLDNGEMLFGFSDGSVVALDADTGDVKWNRRMGEGAYPDIVADPLWSDGVLYVSGYFTPFVAFDVETATLRWRQEQGAASTPILMRDGFIVHPGTDGSLRAYEAVSGDLKWMWDSMSQAALTSPVVTEAGLLVGIGDGTLVLLDEREGQEIWRYRSDFILQGITASPVVEGRQVVFVTNAGWIQSMVSP